MMSSNTERVDMLVIYGSQNNSSGIYRDTFREMSRYNQQLLVKFRESVSVENKKRNEPNRRSTEEVCNES